jgi:hypothetical protein
MFIVGIYSSEDENLAGSRGGSSQCFGVFVEDELYKYDEYLKAYTCTFSTIASPGETLKGATPAIANSGIGEYSFVITTSESATKGSFPQSLLRGNYMEKPLV